MKKFLSLSLLSLMTLASLSGTVYALRQQFSNPNVCSIFTQDGSVYRTCDGGNTSEQLYPPKGPMILQ